MQWFAVEPRQPSAMKRDPSLIFALSASLLIHAAIALTALVFAPGAHTATKASGNAQPGPIFLPQTPDRPDDRMGQEDGRGYALNATPGEKPMYARQADEDQAFTSKDPPGDGAVGSDASWNTSLQGDGVARSQAPALVAPPAQPPAFGMPAPSGTPVAVAPRAPVARAARAPGSAGSGADPAIDADSEVDPFSRLGSAEFRDGRVDARFGRRVKAVRPRLSLAGQVDVLRLAGATVILKVKTDADGQVIDVDVLKTSGSNEIDLACRHALYQWWIQPPKNAQGQPVADTMVWRISWNS